MLLGPEQYESMTEICPDVKGVSAWCGSGELIISLKQLVIFLIQNKCMLCCCVWFCTKEWRIVFGVTLQLQMKQGHRGKG